ncbi:MAG: hypothetical protein MI749_20610 [Desulfovibrionales bacterium]|nr:hypothetical protein [Desulfovibrionales bacterium]
MNIRLVVALIFLVFGAVIYSQELLPIEGIWKSVVNINPQMDSYLSVGEIGEDLYYIVYICPSSNNSLDYTEYGSKNSDGIIEVLSGSNRFFLVFDEGQIIQYWNLYPNSHPEIFRRVTDKPEVLGEISIDEMSEFLGVGDK